MLSEIGNENKYLDKSVTAIKRRSSSGQDKYVLREQLNNQFTHTAGAQLRVSKTWAYGGRTMMFSCIKVRVSFALVLVVHLVFLLFVGLEVQGALDTLLFVLRLHAHTRISHPITLVGALLFVLQLCVHHTV